MDGANQLCYLVVDLVGAHALPDGGTSVMAAMMRVLSIVGGAVLGCG